jgi:hypothetical protein
MMGCTHEVKYLMGGAKGIKCLNCGKLFKNHAEIAEDRKASQKELPPVEELKQELQEAKKKTTKKTAKKS